MSLKSSEANKRARPGRSTKQHKSEPGDREEHQRETRRTVEFTAIGLMMNLSLLASLGTPKAPHREASESNQIQPSSISSHDPAEFKPKRSQTKP